MSIQNNLLPQVSVIVPIYNGEKDLPGLIDCLKKQSYPTGKVEYFLVDNNSSDRTAEIIINASEKAAKEGIKICLLSSHQIQSSYAARNTGIKTSQSKVLAFTDADCRPQADWLKYLIAPFANPEIGIVAGEINPLPGNTIWERYADYQETLSQKHTLAHSFCAYGQTANLAMRREIFKEIGLFRPHLTTGGDADICWRTLRETTWQIEFAPKAIIRHRHRASLKEFCSQWRRYGRSNRYLYELHGVPLQRQLTNRESLYRLSRWLLKELPLTSIKVITKKASPIELITTPIDLISVRERSTGQNTTQLQEIAKEIEFFS